MSANIVLRKTIDNRVDPISASIAHHDFVVGASANVWQSFTPTSSGVGTNEFTIQVPGQNSLWSRKVMVQCSTGLQWNALASVSLQNNTTTDITLPAGTIYYVPYRYGIDFTCSAFPFNSLVQTCNTQINGSTINCQASQVMPLVRRMIQSNPEVRKKLACPSGVTGTAIITNARGTPFDESSILCANEASSGAVSNGTFQAFQFYDSAANALFTNADCSLPSMGANYADGAFYYNNAATYGTSATAGTGQAGTAGALCYKYSPQTNAQWNYPYAPASGSGTMTAPGLVKFDAAVFTNGSTLMLPIDCSSVFLPKASSAGVAQPVTINAVVPVYGTLTTMEPLLFPPFSISDNEVAFSNVQSANIRLTMLGPDDSNARIVRNIEAVGVRNDIPQTFVTPTFASIFGSATGVNNVTGLATCVPQIDSLNYWLSQPGTNGTTITPFNIKLLTNFLSPSLLEPIPETLVYPFIQYTPLVSSNVSGGSSGKLAPISNIGAQASNLNSTTYNSGQILSNVLTLNTCPDMLALYVVLNPKVNKTSATVVGGFTTAVTSITPGTAFTVSALTGTIVVGSTFTAGGSNFYITAIASPTSINASLVGSTSTTAVTITAGTFPTASPVVFRNPTYSYSDVLAAITNVSITWNNNASLLQNFLPSELIEITASNGLPCSQTVAMGVANLPYKAKVLDTTGLALGSTTSTYGSLINSQSAFNTGPTGTIGLPLLLAINKDIPTEAGSAAGVSGVYTLQVQVTTRFFDQGALAANTPQFFVTPIQTQYLQLIRGGTSAVVSAVAAADKMLAAPYAPMRTLQAESPHPMAGGHIGYMHMAGGANHVSKLWPRSHAVHSAVEKAMQAATAVVPTLAARAASRLAGMGGGGGESEDGAGMSHFGSAPHGKRMRY